MKLRKSKILASVASALLMCMPFAASVGNAVADDYTVDGGRLVVDFDSDDDIYKFSCYTEFGALPYVLEGKAYCWVLAEQKMILDGMTFVDVQVDVDIYTIGKNGKFDSGIYVGASGANNKMDGITAWNINIEHQEDAGTYWLKLHRFENNRWLREEMVEISGLPYTKDMIHLRAVVKNGVLSAYVDYNEKAVVTKVIGSEALGAVGLRNFYSPNCFDNFTVVGGAVDIDYAEMNALKSLAEQKLKEQLTENSREELASAVELATAVTSQKDADAASAALSEALDRAELKHTLSELSALVTKADGIQNTDGKVYTANSYAAFTAVKDICSSLTDADGEYEISYWYARLEERMNDLVLFHKETLQ